MQEVLDQLCREMYDLALMQQQGLSAGGSGFDLVHLCSTFAADPYAMAFAQRFASGAAGTGAAGAGGGNAALQAFCRDTFRECIGQVCNICLFLSVLPVQRNFHSATSLIPGACMFGHTAGA
jgi:hypothetical protein